MIKVTIISIIVISIFVIVCKDGPAIEKKVLAFYYPWYRAPDFTGAWGHWNTEGHNPDMFFSPGRRDIASVNYPVLGAYDSLDPDVIDLHIQQSVEADIDAWIISWWGDETEIQLILERIAILESPLKVTAYYERIPGCNSMFCRDVSSIDKINSASKDVVNILEWFSGDPAWLTVENEPVLFIYSRALTQGLLGQGVSVWDEIVQKVESTHPVYISGDADMTFLWGIVPKEFDQIHMYNPAFQSHLFGEWTLDYRGLCNIAHNRGQACALAVIPGYDDSVLPSRDPIIISYMPAERLTCRCGD